MTAPVPVPEPSTPEQVTAAARLVVAHTTAVDDLKAERSYVDLAEVMTTDLDVVFATGREDGAVMLLAVLDVAVTRLARARRRPRRRAAVEVANAFLAEFAPDAERFGT